MPSDGTKYGTGDCPVDSRGVPIVAPRAESAGTGQPKADRPGNAEFGTPNGYRGLIEELIEWMDAHLDADVAEAYKGQPLAQDWARVAKVTEEAGEAIDALIGVTGQNPRKGTYGSWDDLDDELCDVALTSLYALQHFKKNPEAVTRALLNRALYHRKRVEEKDAR